MVKVRKPQVPSLDGVVSDSPRFCIKAKHLLVFSGRKIPLERRPKGFIRDRAIDRDECICTQESDDQFAAYDLGRWAGQRFEADNGFDVFWENQRDATAVCLHREGNERKRWERDRLSGAIGSARG